MKQQKESGYGQEKRISSILNRRERRDAEMPRCTCRVCEARRAQTHACDLCGYVGEPVVWPCTCVGSCKSQLAAYRRAAAETRRGRKRHDRVFGFTHAAALKAIARERTLIANARECPACDPACAHGAVTCPVCGTANNSALSNNDIDGLHAFAMIRDLRRALGRATVNLAAGA